MDSIAANIEQILQQLEDDSTREGLTDTPRRAADALRFMTQGYNVSIEDVVSNALFESDLEEIILVKDIELYSLCEHHIMPFIGKCHVGYLPQGKVLGISKIARIVDLFARRLQIQERLTQQIANAVYEVTSASGVGVIIEAQHLCMAMRGVQKQHSSMKTSVLLGSFRDAPDTRSEFLHLVNQSSS